MWNALEIKHSISQIPPYEVLDLDIFHHEDILRLEVATQDLPVVNACNHEAHLRKLGTNNPIILVHKARLTPIPSA